MNYTKEQAITKAIKIAKGQQMFPGDIVAHESHDLACELIRYEDKFAFCFDGNKEHHFLREEIFSPKQVINIANHFLNLGFWQEGMESTIIKIRDK